MFKEKAYESKTELKGSQLIEKSESIFTEPFMRLFAS